MGLEVSLVIPILLTISDLAKQDNAATNTLDIDQVITKGFALKDHVFWTSKARDSLKCGQLCLRRTLCVSVNYDVRTEVCELNDEVYHKDSNVRFGTNLRYSNISAWPSQVDPHCYRRPCKNDEVCVPAGLIDGQCCSYYCFKLYQRCPVPDGVVTNGSRTLGSRLEPTCRQGFKVATKGVGGIVCMETFEWNVTEPVTCEPIYGSNCQNDSECQDIAGECVDNTCTCNFTYDETTTSCTQDCTDGWFRFETSCYYFGTVVLKYTVARNKCAEMGSTLVQVDTIEEREFLYDKMSNLSQPLNESGYWNDLYEVTVNGEERWRATNDSLDPNVADWNSGQPYDHDDTKQRCTMFFRSFEYKWADVECEEVARRLARALCEKNMVT